MSPRGASFELERFALAPITDGVVLLEVDGRLSGAPARARPPRLLVETVDGDRREHAPVEAVVEDGALRASFAVAAGDAATATLALTVGGLLLELPDPDAVGGADRTVALARQVNGLRRELAELRAEVVAAREQAGGHAAELERLAAAGEERHAAAERAAAERVGTAERVAAERLAEAEADAEARIAAADAAAADRLARDREAASSRQEALAKASAAREAELRRALGEARSSRADAPTVAVPVEGEDVKPEPEVDPEPEPEPEPEVDPETVLHADAAYEADARPDADPDFEDDPATEVVAVPDDTGPIPLRRASDRLAPTRPARRGEADVRSVGAPRTLVLVVVALAGLLVLAAILGFLL